MTDRSKDVEMVREILGNISSLIPDHYGGQPNLVTRDMALDAGEPGLEGSLHGYAPCPGDCPRCLFDQSNDQALAALDRLAQEIKELETEKEILYQQALYWKNSSLKDKK